MTSKLNNLPSLFLYQAIGVMRTPCTGRIGLVGQGDTGVVEHKVSSLSARSPLVRCYSDDDEMTGMLAQTKCCPQCGQL